MPRLNMRLKRFCNCARPRARARRPSSSATGRGARDRARVPGAIGQIAGEHLVLVGRNQHVVVGRLLRENRHLPLRLHVRRSRSAGRRRYPRTCAPRRSSRRISSPSVGRPRRAACRPDASRRPAASASIASRSDIARARRRASNGVGAAWKRLARQSSSRSAIVGRAGVEHQRVLAAPRRRQRAARRRAGRRRRA